MTPTDSDRSIGTAPRLLSRAAEPLPLPPPVHDSDEVASLHVKWAQLVRGGAGAPHDAGGSAPVAAPGGGATAGRVREKVRARVVAAAGVQTVADRALIGDLIRAVDAIAARVDMVAQRAGDLELLLQEVVDRVSEDLVRMQMSLGSLGPRDGAVSHEAADRAQ